MLQFFMDENGNLFELLLLVFSHFASNGRFLRVLRLVIRCHSTIHPLLLTGIPAFGNFLGNRYPALGGLKFRLASSYSGLV